MTAAAFFANFNSRFACSVNLRRGREFNCIGQSQATGLACDQCVGCDSRSGEMGLAETGVALERKHGQLVLSWPCPSCGKTVTEETALLSAGADARAIASDALCYPCRRFKGIAL